MLIVEDIFTEAHEKPSKDAMAQKSVNFAVPIAKKPFKAIPKKAVVANIPKKQQQASKFAKMKGAPKPPN